MASSSSTLNLESPTSLYNFVVRDGNGAKGLMDLGLSKVPKKYIQPPHERINNPDSIPVLQAPPLDLSKLDGSAPERAQVEAQIVRASQTLGFFQVVNHGVSLELMDKLIEAAHTVFNQNEALEYFKLSTKIARDILEILISNLGAKVEDSKIDCLLGESKVLINYYPSCPNPELAVGTGSHSDPGTLTVLLQDDIGGLYIKLEEDSEVGNKGDWIQIPPIPGALVINISDTLQILSNGRYKSAEHIVRTTSNKSRVSIPTFIAAKLTEEIGPLTEVVKQDGYARYREMTFQDFFNNYMRNGRDSQEKKSLDIARIN